MSLNLGNLLYLTVVSFFKGIHSYRRDYPCWSHTRWMLINSNISAPVYPASANIKLFTTNRQRILSTVQDRLITMYAYTSWFSYLYINIINWSTTITVSFTPSASSVQLVLFNIEYCIIFIWNICNSHLSESSLITCYNF